MPLISIAMTRFTPRRAELRAQTPRVQGASDRMVGHPRRQSSARCKRLLGFHNRASRIAEEDGRTGNRQSGASMSVKHEIVHPRRCGAGGSTSDRHHQGPVHLRPPCRQEGSGAQPRTARPHSVQGLRQRDRAAENRRQQAIRLRRGRAPEERVPEDTALLSGTRCGRRGSGQTRPRRRPSGSRQEEQEI